MFGQFDLSTTVCQDHVLFFCNAILSSNSEKFGWFLKDRSIFMELFHTNFSYPYQSSTLLNGSIVRIQNVIRVNDGLFIFNNFVLSAPINVFQEYIGENLTCGQSQQQSSPIIITNYRNRGKV